VKEGGGREGGGRREEGGREGGREGVLSCDQLKEHSEIVLFWKKKCHKKK
jgi:hypothetical protein